MQKKLAILLVFSTLFLGLAFESCKHEPLPVPKNPADTTTKNPSDTGQVVCSPDTVYFVQEILPLLNSSCGMAGCHDAATAQKGLNVTSHQSLITSGEVKPFDPAGSDVYGRIMENDPSKKMPPPSSGITLTAEQKAAIYKWIQQGAKNNSCQPSGCDTTNLTYVSGIEPVLKKYCTNCHSGPSPSKGVDLGSYASVKAAASNGSFLGTIEHQAGYTPMPLGQQKLSGCDINKIKHWVNTGMP